MAKKIRTLFLFCILAALIITCKKNNIDNPVQQPGEEQIDLSAKVIASVSGFVTNELNAAVEGANVQYGASTASTDKYGYFEIKNATVTEQAAFVTVNMTGYFKGIKTFAAQEGKENFCRIKLIPKTNTGTINAVNGGDVSLANGLSISFPANGIMDAATNAAYTGTVHVASFWIDPTGNDLERLMPGDLRGINENNFMRTLTTYGMAAVELTGDAGELLQIAEGKKATLTLPIPSAILANAPATIPLWYFDESIGLWKEEAAAIKSGNNYTGEVSHFSFWNYDVPSIMSFLDFTIVDHQGNVISQACVKITDVNEPVNYRTVYTNADGHVAGYVPKDKQLLLEVLNEGCIVFALPLSTVGQNNIQLGNIAIPPSRTATLTGAVFNCNNQPVTHGRIISKYGNRYSIHNINNDGTFHFQEIMCDDTTAFLFFAEDIDAFSQSSPVFLNLVIGTTGTHDFQTCDALIGEFISYTIDGTQYLFTAPSSMLSGVFDPFGTNILIIKVVGATTPHIYINDTAPGVTDDRILQSFADTYLTSANNPVSPITVHLTQYGQVGELIEGYFEGDFHVQPSGPDHHVTCSFRVTRYP